MKSQFLQMNWRVLFLASLGAIITVALFYFDEGRNNFGFLTDRSEVFNFIVFYILVTIIPISIYFFNVASKHSKLSIYFALIGYIPSVILLFKL